MTERDVMTASGPIAVIVWWVDLGDRAIAISSIRAPQGGPADLNGALELSAANIGGQVLDARSVKVHGNHPAREARFTGSQQGVEVTAFCRVVASSTRVVQVVEMVEGANVKKPPSDYQDLVDSLKLT
jgi:hypothetical protein